MNRLHANQHPSAEELRNIFASAPRDFGPVPIWWWSGGKVTREGIRHQMERMARGGLCNVMILNLAPCGTIFGCCPDNPRFLSEGWWENFAFAVEEGKRLGIRLWFYDQLGFSGASLQAGLVTRHPGFQGVRLVREFRDVEGPSELVLPPPPWAPLFPPSSARSWIALSCPMTLVRPALPCAM